MNRLISRQHARVGGSPLLQQETGVIRRVPDAAILVNDSFVPGG
jgi:hypothetical protein